MTLPVAVAASHKKYSHVINMNSVRVVNADDASITPSGLLQRHHLHCPEGCQYFASDVAGFENLR